MSSSIIPAVVCDRVHPGLTVSNIDEAINYYTQKLGFVFNFKWGDPPDMAGVSLGNISVHLFLGAPVVDLGKVYFVVEDVDALYEFHRNNGIDIFAPPSNKPYELRDYHIHDLYGNILGFGQYIYSKQPPLKIERVPVPVRLEKRLAALLSDLAGHKGMSIDSTLEETLLHTFEAIGDNVASPHT
jgi:catechol 2,3-dioxygenase-like lactoylglutathione lyase family enzyme